MHDIEIFRPLYDALVPFIKAQRVQAAFTTPWGGKPKLTDEQRLANKTLTLLVQAERNMGKMFTAARVGHGTKYVWAGHHLVAMLLAKFVKEGYSDYFEYPTTHPIWDLPLTKEMRAVVLAAAEVTAENHRKVYPDARWPLQTVEIAALGNVSGATLREVTDAYQKQLRLANERARSAHMRRVQQKAKLLEKLKDILAPEEMALLLDKSI